MNWMGFYFILTFTKSNKESITINILRRVTHYCVFYAKVYTFWKVRKFEAKALGFLEILEDNVPVADSGG